MSWITEGVYFSNSFLRGWSIQEGGHFARVRYMFPLDENSKILDVAHKKFGFFWFEC